LQREKKLRLGGGRKNSQLRAERLNERIRREGNHLNRLVNLRGKGQISLRVEEEGKGKTNGEKKKGFQTPYRQDVGGGRRVPGGEKKKDVDMYLKDVGCRKGKGE